MRPRIPIATIVLVGLAVAVTWWKWPKSSSTPELRDHHRGDPSAPIELPAKRAEAPGATIDVRVTSDPDRKNYHLVLYPDPVRHPEPLRRAEGVPPFVFDDLATGEYCVVAYAQGSSGSACGVYAVAGRRATVEITLTPGGYKLHGRVEDGGGGPAPFPQLVAWQYPLGEIVFHAVGDTDGRYSLQLPPGRYSVAVMADGYTTARSFIEVLTDIERNFSLNPGGTIEGRVLLQNGSPAPGAKVFTEAPGYFEPAIECDDAGAFRLTNLRPGFYELHARSADAPQRGSTEVSLTLGATETTEIRLSPGFALSGVVVAAETKRPIEGAVVEVQGPEIDGQFPTKAGRFEVTGLALSNYNIKAEAEGFARSDKTVLVGSKERTDVTIELHAAASLRGRVVAATDKPVPFARIHLDNTRVSGQANTADEAGTFEIHGLEPGAVRVSAEHPDHGLTEAMTLDLVAGETSTAELAFGASSSLAGRVGWTPGDKPAAGVLVTATSQSEGVMWRTATASDGTFAFAPLPAGNYSVAAKHPGSLPRVATQNGESFAHVALGDGEAKTGVALTLPSGDGAVTGTVSDAAGSPVSGAAVWAERMDERISIGGPMLHEVRTYTMPDGAFSLEHLPIGVYSIFAAHPDHSPGIAAKVRPGDRDVKVELPAQASVSGQVIDASGSPVSTFVLRWSFESREHHLDGSRRVVHDDRGRFSIPRLPPSKRYTFEATSADGAHGKSASFALASGQKKENLTIEVELPGTIVGRIVNKDSGEPVAAVGVFGPGAGEVRTDVEGYFELRDVPVGDSQSIGVRSRDGSSSSENLHYPVAVKPGEVTEVGDVRVNIE